MPKSCEYRVVAGCEASRISDSIPPMPKGFRDAQQKAPWRGELAITGAGPMKAKRPGGVELLPHELGAWADHH